MRQHRRIQVETDRRFGEIAAVLANLHRNPKKRPKAFEPADFFPSVPKAGPHIMTQEQLAAAIRGVFGGRGASDGNQSR